MFSRIFSGAICLFYNLPWLRLFVVVMLFMFATKPKSNDTEVEHPDMEDGLH